MKNLQESLFHFDNILIYYILILNQLIYYIFSYLKPMF